MAFFFSQSGTRGKELLKSYLNKIYFQLKHKTALSYFTRKAVKMFRVQHHHPDLQGHLTSITQKVPGVTGQPAQPPLTWHIPGTHQKVKSHCSRTVHTLPLLTQYSKHTIPAFVPKPEVACLPLFAFSLFLQVGTPHLQVAEGSIPFTLLWLLKRQHPS